MNLSLDPPGKGQRVAEGLGVNFCGKQHRKQQGCGNWFHIENRFHIFCHLQLPKRGCLTTHIGAKLHIQFY